MRATLLALAAMFLATTAQADAAHLPTCFIGPVFIAGVADGQCITPARRDQLIDAPVVDWDRKPAPLLMQAAGSPNLKMTVTTCREWTEAMSLSRAAMRATNRGREQFYLRTCQTLDQLLLADPATQSFIKSDGTDLAKPALVPARLLELAGVKGPKAPEGASVWDMRRRDGLVVRDHKIGVMEVTWRDQDFALNPTGRGDVDRDGVEDLIIAMECVMHGSRASGVMIVHLTRRSAGGPLEVVYPKPRG